MRAGDCRHFTGVMNPRCAAGIAYAGVRVEKAPFADNLPCLGSSGNVGKCPKYVATTKEEEAALRKEMDEAFRFTMEARKTIMATGHAAGAVDCPKCRIPKALWFRVHSNDHVHASCQTKDCLRWME